MSSAYYKYLTEQTVSIDESMVPCFGKHGSKRFTRNKSVKFGHAFWIAATPLRYAIQFYYYIGKDENFDPTRGLCGSVVSKLAGSLPK